MTRRLARICFWGALACAWLAASGARAQAPLVDQLLPGPKSAEPAAPDPASELEAKRAEVSERLSVARRTQEAAGARADGAAVPAEASAGKVDLLKRLDVLYAQHQTALDKQTVFETEKRTATERLDALRSSGLDEPPPYSFFLLDRVRDELETLVQRQQSAQTVIDAASDSLERAKQAADEGNRRRRQATEAAAKRKAGQEPDQDARPVELFELEAQIADEHAKLRRIELQNERLAREVVDLQVILLQEKIALVEPQVTLSDADRREKLVELDKEESDLNRRLDAAEVRLQALSERLAAVEGSADLVSDNRPERTAELAARRARRATQQQHVTLLKQQLQRLGERRESWTRRFAARTGSASSSELSKWIDSAAAAIEQLKREDGLQDLRIDEVRSEFANVEKRLQSTEADQRELVQWLNDHRGACQELINHYGEDIASIESARRVQQRLLSEIEADRQRFSPGQWLSRAWEQIENVWRIEIYATEDHSVTVSKFVWGVVLFVVGVLVSRYASRTIGRRLLPRVGVHAGAAAAMESISFYTMVLLATLLALRWVNVPLTLFTFLGGAVAIGVGFGSQNLVNNFMSGLILFAERPVRVGDMIEIDNLIGSVEHIGARSTRIRTAMNTEIIVPNSTFLETNVVNWTLSDKRLRGCVSVGVAYGSPTREVARWLRKAADEHGQVLDRPEPFVWFVGFGDNSLQFELYYWIQIRQLSERRRIESDLRYIIDQYFRDAGLVIAYPQRDLHLSNDKPLRVALSLPEAAEKDQGDSGRAAAA